MRIRNLSKITLLVSMVAGLGLLLASGPAFSKGGSKYVKSPVCLVGKHLAEGKTAKECHAACDSNGACAAFVVSGAACYTVGSDAKAGKGKACATHCRADAKKPAQACATKKKK